MECEKIISQYISKPTKDTENPPVHTTGGAVDVTIVNEIGQEIDMGTGFDDFSEKAHTYYFEQTTENNIVYNRRMLYNAMIAAGFTNLPSEWWHYDYGDKFWAYYNRKGALYNGIFRHLTV